MQIIETPSRDDSIEKYQIYYPSNIAKSAAFDVLEFGSVKTPEDQYLGLFDKNSLVSHLHLETRTANLWQITYSLTRDDFQRQGCFRYLLLKALDFNQQVLSDSHHTPQAALAWQSLIKFPGDGMKIFIYDVDSQQLTPTEKNKDRYSIWNNNESPLLLAVKTTKTQASIDRSAERDRVMEKYNRHSTGIWFGKNSSNSEYTNP